MPSTEIVQALLQQATSSGSRSTAMQPLCWLAGIILSGIIGSAYYNAPIWLLVTLAVFLGFCISLFLGIYTYFAIKNPDALRSEKFTLSKMAIEKNLIGDNNVGLTAISEYEDSKIVSALPSKTEVSE
jgi:hypothetical protein